MFSDVALLANYIHLSVCPWWEEVREQIIWFKDFFLYHRVYQAQSNIVLQRR